MRQKFSTIDDYKAFALRAKYRILVPFLVVFGITTIVAFVLPSVYQASSTILIETQQIPPDFIRSTVTSYAEERLKVISQEIMSRANLSDIIARFGLYGDMKGKSTTEETVTKMRDDIKLETISAAREGSKSTTVAFTLSYEGRDPNKVQNVANALASLYLEANLKTRTSNAETTVQFLENQVELYRKQCSELEAKIAGFKEKHMGELPELFQLNLQTEQQMRNQLDTIDRDMRTLQDRKILLEGQLSTVKPSSPATQDEPTKRLKELKSRLVTLTSSFSEKHPDVVRVKKEVAELEQQLQVKDDLAKKRKELEEKRTSLNQLLGRATEKHPDVIRLKKEIAQCEEEIAQGERHQTSVSATENPDNPAYIGLKTQISATELDIAALKKQRTELHQKWMAYLQRLDKAPQVEFRFTDLARDHDNAKTKFRETMDKLMEAKQGLTLEESQAGERFTIIDPAHFPERPAKPNRPAIVLIGLILGLGAGIGYAAVVEFADTSIRDAGDLQEVTGLPVLAVIPRIISEEELAASGGRKWLYVALGIAVFLVVVLTVIHFAVMDIEVLWFKVLRRLQL